MKGLSLELTTEQGESRLLRRLAAIDAARALIGTVLIDAEGEDFDFRTFPLDGISEAVDIACQMLSGVTKIPMI